MFNLSNLVTTGVLGIAITLFGLATVASATTINVDFNVSGGTAGTYVGTGAYSLDTGTHWNAYTLGTGTSGSLMASDGTTSTSVTFGLTGWTVADDVSSSITTNCAPALLNDYAGANGTFTIGHLLANEEYQLYLYSTNGGWGGIATTFTVGTSTATATPDGSNPSGFIPGNNYVTLTGTSDASGTLTGTFAQSNWGAFNGIQIVGVIPEPGTLVLLVMGLFGLLCYAWRKRK